MRIPGRVLTVAIMALAAQGAQAGINSNAGTATGSFLQMGGGTRSIAMGGTGSALVSDSSAIWTNPGQIAGLANTELSFIHGKYVEDVSVNNALIATPLPVGAVCFALSMVSMGKIDSFDVNGDAAGTIEPKDMGVTAGYAVEAGIAGLGASLTFMSSQLAPDAKATAVAADIGGRVAVLPFLFISGSAQHLGSAMKFGSKTSSLPLVVRGGVAGDLLSGRIRLAGDVVKPSDSGMAILAGGEVTQPVTGEMSVCARGGWRSVAPKGGNSGISAGGGLIYRFRVPVGSGEAATEGAGVRDILALSAIRVDYAWNPLGELGTAHWLSFSLAF